MVVCVADQCIEPSDCDVAGQGAFYDLEKQMLMQN
jgi:hypothetical protein